MKLTRLVCICMDCKMNWVAPIWEPKWLSIKMAKESHEEYHDMVLNPESNPIAIAWMKHEREHIVAMLKSELERMKKESPNGEHYHNGAGIEAAIQLIKQNYDYSLWRYQEDDDAS